MNRRHSRNYLAFDLFMNRSYARLLNCGRYVDKKLGECSHCITILGRAAPKPAGLRNAGSGAGSHASTGTSNRLKASSGVRIVGSKYSVVNAIPMLKAIARQKAREK